MGNRAVMQWGKDKDAIGIYLHWNGGQESVQAFLDVAKALGVRDDGDYEIARVAQIIGNFFGGTTSVGVGLASNMDRDNGDNGTFIIDKLSIVGRMYPDEKFAPIDVGYYKGVYDSVMEKNKDIFLKKETA